MYKYISSAKTQAEVINNIYIHEELNVPNEQYHSIFRNKWNALDVKHFFVHFFYEYSHGYANNESIDVLRHEHGQSKFIWEYFSSLNEIDFFLISFKVLFVTAPVHKIPKPW